jgi:hypothetical protein
VDKLNGRDITIGKSSRDSIERAKKPGWNTEQPNATSQAIEQMVNLCKRMIVY